MHVRQQDNATAEPMDERRKRAYRYLLYRAMLDIRPIAWLRLRNPPRWPDEVRRIRQAGALADWLHNLALFSSLDFTRFDEECSWKDGQSLKARYPGLDPERYHRLFEEQLVADADV
jgi:hypothetical protein